MRKTHISLHVHKEVGTSNLTLDDQDVYNHIGEYESDDLKVAEYVSKWCEMLNYPFMNQSPAHGDPKLSQLRGWIDGFNFANDVTELELPDKYILDMKKYHLEIEKPFSI